MFQSTKLTARIINNRNGSIDKNRAVPAEVAVSSSPIADVFVLGLTFKGIFLTAVLISVAFISAYMLMEKKMNFTAVAVLLYLVNIPLNFANLGPFFKNWFYNFLDVAFYVSAVLLVVEAIRYVKANSTGRHSAISKPIQPVHYRHFNRTMVAVWAALLLQEIMSKYDLSRSLIETVYWKKLTYDPYDMVAYTVGLIAFFAIANRFFRQEENSKNRRNVIIGSTLDNRRSSSPITARILIVDDEEWQRELVRIVLEREGYVVEEAANGREALEKFNAGRFDLVVTDNRMPEMYGTVLVGELIKLNPTLPIIFMSGTERITETQRIKNVSKPYDINVFAKQVAELLELSSSSPVKTIKELKAEIRALEAKVKRLESEKAELEKVSRVDSLTNLYNRRDFDDTLKGWMRNADRIPGRRLLFVLIDIDFFGIVNNIFGHSAGDKVLKLFANTVKNKIRPAVDYIARYGGEEFALLLTGVDEELARERIINRCAESVKRLGFPVLQAALRAGVIGDKIAEITAAADRAKMHSAIIHQLSVQGLIGETEKERLNGLPLEKLPYASLKKWVITFSAGVASYQKGMPGAELLRRADEVALAVAKIERNNIEIFTGKTASSPAEVKVNTSMVMNLVKEVMKEEGIDFNKLVSVYLFGSAVWFKNPDDYDVVIFIDDAGTEKRTFYTGKTAGLDYSIANYHYFTKENKESIESNMELIRALVRLYSTRLAFGRNYIIKGPDILGKIIRRFSIFTPGNLIELARRSIFTSQTLSDPVETAEKHGIIYPHADQELKESLKSVLYGGLRIAEAIEILGFEGSDFDREGEEYRLDSRSDIYRLLGELKDGSLALDLKLVKEYRGALNNRINNLERASSLKPSSPLGATVTTIIKWLILRHEQTSGIINNRELALYAGISLEEVAGLVNQINNSGKIKLISEGAVNWRIKVISSSPVSSAVAIKTAKKEELWANLRSWSANNKFEFLFQETVWLTPMNVWKEEGTLFKIELGGRIAGFIFYHYTRDHKGLSINAFIVRPGYRNKGIGSEVLKSIIGNNPGRYIIVDPLSSAAEDFYKKHGFEKTFGDNYIRPASTTTSSPVYIKDVTRKGLSKFGPALKRIANPQFAISAIFSATLFAVGIYIVPLYVYPFAINPVAKFALAFIPSLVILLGIYFSRALLYKVKNGFSIFTDTKFAGEFTNIQILAGDRLYQNKIEAERKTEAEIKRGFLEKNFSYIVKKPLVTIALGIAGAVIAYLALVPAVFSLSLAMGTGLVVGILLPYLIKVTLDFFGSQHYSDLRRAVEMSSINKDASDFIDMVGRIQQELRKATKLQRVFYIIQASWIRLSILRPELSGLLKFITGRLTVAVLSGIVAKVLAVPLAALLAYYGINAYAPVIFSSLPLVKTLNKFLPISVEGLFNIAIIVLGFKFLNLRGIISKVLTLMGVYDAETVNVRFDSLSKEYVRKILEKGLLHSFGRPALRALVLEELEAKFRAKFNEDIAVRKTSGDKLIYYALAAIISIAFIVTSPFAALIFWHRNRDNTKKYYSLWIDLGREFRHSFVYMWTIGAEIGTVIMTGSVLARVPYLNVIGKPLDAVAQALEGQYGAIAWGQHALNLSQQALGINFTELGYYIFGVKENNAGHPVPSTTVTQRQAVNVPKDADKIAGTAVSHPQVNKGKVATTEDVPNNQTDIINHTGLAPPVEDLKDIEIKVDVIEKEIKEIEKTGLLASEKIKRFEGLVSELSEVKPAVLKSNSDQRRALFIRIANNLRTISEKITNEKINILLDQKGSREKTIAEVERYETVKEWLKNIPVSYPDESHLADVAFLYDISADGIMLVDLGKYSQAEGIIDTLYKWWQKNKNREFTDNNDNKYTLNGFPISFKVLDASPFEHDANGRAIQRLGPNAWLLNFLSHYIYKTQNTRYIDFAKDIADYLVSLQDTDVKSQTYKGLKDGPGAVYYATEPNISAKAALANFAVVLSQYEQTEAIKYSQASEGIKDFLKNAHYIRKDETVLINLFGKKLSITHEKHLFRRGYCEANGGWDKFFASDLAPWAVLSMPEEEIKNVFGVSARQLLMDSISEAEVTVDYKHPEKGQITGITLVDFTNQEGRLAIGRGVKADWMASVEWSLFTALALQKIGEADKAKSYYETILKLADKKGFLPYATLAIKPTGHEWSTPHSYKALISSIWAAFLENKENPFILNKEQKGFVSRNDQEFLYGYHSNIEVETMIGAIDRSYADLDQRLEHMSKIGDPRTSTDLFGLSVGLHYLTGALLANASLGDFNLGIGSAGYLGSAIEIGFIAEGLIHSSVNPFLGGYVLLSKLVDLTNAPLKKEIDDYGAVIYIDNPEAKILELTIKGVSLFGTVRLGLQQDRAVIEKIDGDINEGVINSLKLPFVDLKSLFKDKYEAIIIPSQATRYAYAEGVFNPKENCTYFIMRQGEYQYIVRYNYKENKIDVLSGQRIFIKETNKFLQDSGLWSPDNRVIPIYGVNNLTQINEFFRGFHGWGVKIDGASGKVSGVNDLRDLRFTVEIATDTPYPIFFEPQTGNIVIGGLKMVLLYSAFKSGKEVKYDFRGNEIVAKPAQARVVSDNGIYYISSLEDLARLPVVKLADDLIVDFGSNKKVVIKKDTYVTFQKPFRKVVKLGDKEYVIPAVVEYSNDAKAQEYTATVMQNGQKVYTNELYLTYREQLTWKDFEDFWQDWIKEYSVESMVNIPKEAVKAPREVIVEKKMHPQGIGLGIEAIKEVNVKVGWPGTASKEMIDSELWYKTYSISLGRLLNIDIKTQNVVLDECGYLKSGQLKAGEQERVNDLFYKYLLTKREILAVKTTDSNTPAAYEKTGQLFREYAFHMGQDEPRWSNVLFWGGDKQGILEGLQKLGVVYSYGEKPRALKEEEFGKLKTLMYLEDAELAKLNIERRVIDKGVIYILNVNNKEMPLNVYIDSKGSRQIIANADRMLLLPLGNAKFGAVELGLEGLKKNQEILESVGLVYSQTVEGEHEILSEEKLAEIIKNAGRYNIKDAQGNIVPRVKYGETEGILEFGKIGQKILSDYEDKSVAMLIEHKTGQVGLIDSEAKLPVQKMYLVPQPRSPTGFELKTKSELTEDDKKSPELSIVDAIVVPSTQERYLIEYNLANSKPVASINFRAENGETIQPIELNPGDLTKGVVAFKDFSKIKKLGVNRTSLVEMDLFGKIVEVESKLTSDTLIYREGGKDYIVYFSQEVQKLFDSAMANWGYQVIPDQGVRVYTTKNSLPLGQDFQKMDDGRVIDKRTGGLVVYGKQAEEAIFVIDYKSGQMNIREAIQNGKTKWRVYREAGEVIIGNEVYEHKGYKGDEVITGAKIAEVNKLGNLVFAGQKKEVWQRKDMAGTAPMRTFVVEKGFEFGRIYYRGNNLIFSQIIRDPSSGNEIGSDSYYLSKKGSDYVVGSQYSKTRTMNERLSYKGKEYAMLQEKDLQGKALREPFVVNEQGEEWARIKDNKIVIFFSGDKEGDIVSRTYLVEKNGLYKVGAQESFAVRTSITFNNLPVFSIYAGGEEKEYKTLQPLIGLVMDKGKEFRLRGFNKEKGAFTLLDENIKDYKAAKTGDLVSRTFNLELKDKKYFKGSQESFAVYRGKLITNEKESRELPIFAIFEPKYDDGKITDFNRNIEPKALVVGDSNSLDEYGQIVGSIIVNVKANDIEAKVKVSTSRAFRLMPLANGDYKMSKQLGFSLKENKKAIDKSGRKLDVYSVYNAEYEKDPGFFNNRNNPKYKVRTIIVDSEMGEKLYTTPDYGYTEINGDYDTNKEEESLDPVNGILNLVVKGLFVLVFLLPFVSLLITGIRRIMAKI
ncbi:MAG: GNAT family N-acetyltransferase, partial [Candidatus Omnitrophota bacterium]